MIKAQGGDKRCYASLLVECEKWLRRYYGRKINPSAIDDLVQETLISLHRKRASYDPTKAFCPGSRPLVATAGSTVCARYTGTNMTSCSRKSWPIRRTKT